MRGCGHALRFRMEADRPAAHPVVVALSYLPAGFWVGCVTLFAWALRYVCVEAPPTPLSVWVAVVAAGLCATLAPVGLFVRFRPVSAPARIALGMAGASLVAIVATEGMILVDGGVPSWQVIPELVSGILVVAGYTTLLTLPATLLSALILEGVLAGLRWRAGR